MLAGPTYTYDAAHRAPRPAAVRLCRPGRPGSGPKSDTLHCRALLWPSLRPAKRDSCFPCAEPSFTIRAVFAVVQHRPMPSRLADPAANAPASSRCDFARDSGFAFCCVVVPSAPFGHKIRQHYGQPQRPFCAIHTNAYRALPISMFAWVYKENPMLCRFPYPDNKNASAGGRETRPSRKNPAAPR